MCANASSAGGKPSCRRPPHVTDRFAIDEATIEAIRRALDEGGELSAIAELHRHMRLDAVGRIEID
jgi:hypothetical protein